MFILSLAPEVLLARRCATKLKQIAPESFGKSGSALRGDLYGRLVEIGNVSTPKMT